MAKKAQSSSAESSGESSGEQFEQRLARLEKIVETLEQGTSSLEVSLKLYEEGIVIAASCSKELERAQTRLQQLSKNAQGALKLTDLEEDE